MAYSLWPMTAFTEGKRHLYKKQPQAKSQKAQVRASGTRGPLAIGHKP